MINMDMIGRIRDRKVMVGGAPPGSSLRDLLDTLGAKYKLDLDYRTRPCTARAITHLSSPSGFRHCSSFPGSTRTIIGLRTRGEDRRAAYG